jgi:hypothetical protein
MNMARVSKNIGFTVPPRMIEEFERLASEEGSTKSELFRRMFRLYQSYRTPIERRGLGSASWVERLLAEAQAEESQSPLRDEEFREGIERAMRYSTERISAAGVSSEEEINTLIYEERQRNRNASRRS